PAYALPTLSRAKAMAKNYPFKRATEPPQVAFISLCSPDDTNRVARVIGLECEQDLPIEVSRLAPVLMRKAGRTYHGTLCSLPSPKDNHGMRGIVNSMHGLSAEAVVFIYSAKSSEGSRSGVAQTLHHLLKSLHDSGAVPRLLAIAVTSSATTAPLDLDHEGSILGLAPSSSAPAPLNTGLCDWRVVALECGTTEIANEGLGWLLSRCAGSCFVAFS
ncbi:MAG: hypothetical protein SGPRY_011434, partial [Prymnesium sp.]